MTKNTQKTPSYTSVDIKKLPQSQIEITASVSSEIMETYRTQALKNINNSIIVDGFRKGNVPENIIVAKVGDMAILEEMSELAISKAYMDIIIDNKIDAIGKPQVSVNKLATGNPVEFKIITAVVPEIKLPDYKNIAQAEIKKNDSKDLEVTPQDIEDSILRIRKSKVSHEGHDHEKMTPEEHDKAIEASMPELTDDFVKTLGDFSDVPDFKNKLSDMIAENKRDQAREKTRIRIADAIAEKTTVEIPDLMIESELERTQAQFSADVERMGVKLEDYLKHAKKTLDEVKKEWRPHAEKKAKLQLILNEIARLEKIYPSTEEIEEEINHIVEHYKDADRERVGTYAETVLTNEKVFAWLESEEK